MTSETENSSTRYLARTCNNCDTDWVPVTEVGDDFTCNNCMAPIPYTQIVDKIEMEDAYKTYLGAKKAGLISDESWEEPYNGTVYHINDPDASWNLPK